MLSSKMAARFLILCPIILLTTVAHGAADDAPLPPGVKAVWDFDKASRDKTPTRERICLNGLWRFQPAGPADDSVPAGKWGFFKVPGPWPGHEDWLQKDSQTLYPHSGWKSEKLAAIPAAWYQREVVVPKDFTGRRIAIDAQYVNSFAVVYLDGKKAGEIRFPGGEVDVTSLCRPGEKQILSILVVAMPLKAVMMSYNDTSAARQVKGQVERRGLCGDVFLTSTPAAVRLGDVKVDTSVRKWEITFSAAAAGAKPDGVYSLRAQVLEGGRAIKEFKSQPLKPDALGRFTFTTAWKPEKLWDTHTPQNMYEAQVSLLDSAGAVLDTLPPQRFGFREFWIDGRDFYLNGSRIFLTCIPLDNAQIGAGMATYTAAKETLQRLQSFGVNFVYTHNYGCEPGSHISFAEALAAADDVGMLVSFSQPHFGQYDWKAADADATNGYATHAEFYVRAAQSHPAVVAYGMSHNACGTEDEMNPDVIDGLSDQRNQWAANNAKLARRAEAIVTRLDPGRIVYHHSSGNLGSMHTANFYGNFAPIQEMSDWFEHWATKGVKPLFLCEYGVPMTWDWAMYRGWYKGKREFGSAKVPWELCLAEWNAQFLGDKAYAIGEMEKAALRWEAKQFRSGGGWFRWDYPRDALASSLFDDRQTIFAMYLTDNLRAFRTWGLSGVCPWDHGQYWRLRDGADRGRKQLKVDWDNLQRPGFSPDYVEGRTDSIEAGYERSDWVQTVAAEALIRNSQPLLAYIAGKPARFTSKDHNFLPGEAIEKQIVIINNARQTVTCACQWSVNLPKPGTGSTVVTVETGQQTRVLVRFDLPAGLAEGAYELSAAVKFSNGQTQKDSFAINVLAQPPAVKPAAKIALFDPKGETGQLLKAIGVQTQSVQANADLSSFDMLIIGKAALTVDGAGPNVARVREGLKVLMFEQSADVLEKRLGFRVAEYGLRQVFPRVPDHPALAGISADNLRNWRGEATILPPRLKYEQNPQFNLAPTVKWCGIDVTRIWRCGNLGNVASVLIEKPACGDFLPILDGGFGLQYSPLMEYREGKGLLVLCQLDVTGRSENDPAAERLARDLIEYVAAWKPSPIRSAIYAGEPAGKTHIEKTGVSPGAFDGAKLAPDQVLIVGPGGGRQLAPQAAAISEWLKAGGHILAIGLDQAVANAFLSTKLATKKAEHIAAVFEPFGMASLLRGISPADVYNRDPRDLPLVTGGATIVGNGVLAHAQAEGLLFCQLVPWEFDAAKPPNAKRTFRRCSFLLARLMGNMGVAMKTPLLDRFAKPPDAKAEQRWLNGLYLDQPQDWDDPYRFFCW